MKNNIKKVFPKTAVLFVSLFICLLGLEIYLRSDLYDYNNGIWVPVKYKIYTDKINLFNYEVAKFNQYGFTDRERKKEKGKNIHRIAILGDSFVFGGGMPFTRSWNHRLEEKILQKYSNTEVLSWARSGWSTQDEFEFFKTEGYKYKPDLVLVGFVTNDPDLKDPLNPQRIFQWQDNSILNPLKYLFPNATDFLVTYINQFIENKIFRNHGYTHWENNLYSERNLNGYDTLIKEMYDFAKEKKIKLTFVLTPNNYSDQFRKKFDLITQILNKHQIEYLDLYPIIVEKLSQYKGKELCATPSDCHPGEKVVDIYVEEVFNYLKAKNYLK